METHLLLQIFGILLILFFFFVLYMCWQTWRATHLVFLFLVFATSIAFVAFAAMSMKNQTAWRKVHHELETRLAQVVEEGEFLAHGELLEVVQTEPSLRSAKAELGRILLDQGRVWRRCPPGNVGADGTVTVETVPIDAIEGEEPAHGIEEKFVLYAFQEVETDDGWSVPVFYLGEFQVNALTETTVTLAPTIPLDDDQQAQLQRREGTWALYEMMPVDSHEALAVSEPDEQHLFGRMEEQQLREFIPQGELPADRYEQLLQRYLRDGQRAGDDDPPENVWLKVRFVKKHQVQVDSEAAQATLNDTYFDSTGRAVMPRLLRTEPAEFQVGDLGVFDRETAQQWIAEGICEMVEPIYVRQLNDYALHFQELFNRNQATSEAIRLVQRDTDAMQEAKSKVEHQIRYRQQEKAKLDEDVVKFQYEREQITQYAQTLEQKWRQLRTDLSQLYRTNNVLAEELAALHKQLTREIDQRTEQATAAVR